MLKMAAAAAIGLVALYALPVSPEPVQGEFAGQNFVVKEDDRQVVYALDGATNISGTLTVTGGHIGVLPVGEVATLHYLDDAATAEFFRTQKAGDCKAPFFNAHAQHKFMMPATPKVEAELRSLDFSDYRETSAWRRFRMSGYCIHGGDEVFASGYRRKLSSSKFENCDYMVATAIAVEANPLPQTLRK